MGLPARSPTRRETDPKAVVFQDLTVKDWSDLCHMLAEGVQVKAACEDLLIRYATYRRALRESPGEITKKIQDTYMALVRGRGERAPGWITPVSEG